MKLEIELDLNQIDYEAINKQIQDKIEAMDLTKEYQINNKIESYVREEVNAKVNRYLTSGTWGGYLNDQSKREINDEIQKNIRELIQPHIENIFNQIPQEELNKIIYNLLPNILVNLLISRMGSMIDTYQLNGMQSIYDICNSQINSIFNR